MTTTVGAWMTRDVVKTSAEESLFTAVEQMAERRIRHVLILEGDEIIGIVSNRDIVRAVMLHPDRGLDLHGTRIAEVMTRAPLRTTSPERSLAEVSEEMLAHRVNAIPVLEGSHLVGIITSDDVLRAVASSDCERRRADV